MADNDDRQELQTTTEISVQQETEAARDAQSWYEAQKDSREAENLQDAILATLRASNANRSDKD